MPGWEDGISVLTVAVKEGLIEKERREGVGYANTLCTENSRQREEPV